MMNNITQQLKERAREHVYNFEYNPTNDPDVSYIFDAQGLDTLMETTITELIEHIEGEIGEKAVVDPQSKFLGAKDIGYNHCHSKVLSLLSDIKKGV